MLPADQALTERGCEPEGRGRVLVIACGALAREILEITKVSGLDHVDLACLPAILHNTPDRIPEAVRAAVERHRADYKEIFVGYADCGTGGRLERLCEELGVGLLEGPHCYSFFEGNQLFAAHAETEFTAFYLTDFLVRQFDSFVVRPLGLDRFPELREQYFGNYEKLVYLAQTDDADLDLLAEGHAQTLGLAYERRLTGYGDLAGALRKL